MTFPLKIAIVGPECSGKTTLARALCEDLQQQGMAVRWVPEYARAYYAERPYQPTMQDIEQIAQGQLQAERQAAAGAPLLLCDSTVLTCKIWAEVAFGEASAALLALYQPQDYALTLLAQPDIPWQADPLRSHPKQRDHLYALYQAALVPQAQSVVVLAGSHEQRMRRAKLALFGVREQS